jgi:hypothetical protein
MRLQILEPCREDWTKMRSAGHNRRYCDGCQKHVLDLAGLSEVAAKSLVEAELCKGPVCIRLAVDERGEARFAPQTVVNPCWHRMAFVAGLVLATLSGCADPRPETVTREGCTYAVGPWTFRLTRGEGTCRAAGADANEVVMGGVDHADQERAQLRAAQEELRALHAAQAKLSHELGGYRDDPIVNEREREDLLAAQAELVKEQEALSRKLGRR